MIYITKEMSEPVDKLRQELADHPLYKRRSEVERQFLDELTALTRKYGLELHADTRSEYGESYPDLSLKAPYAGTEARYVFSDYRGIAFEKGETLLECGPECVKAFKTAKAQRAEEDKVISELERKLSNAHWKMMDAGMQEGMRRQMAEYAEKVSERKPEFVCPCGAKFKTDAKLVAHKDKTGHGA